METERKERGRGRYEATEMLWLLLFDGILFFWGGGVNREGGVKIWNPSTPILSMSVKAETD